MTLPYYHQLNDACSIYYSSLSSADANGAIFFEIVPLFHYSDKYLKYNIYVLDFI